MSDRKTDLVVPALAVRVPAVVAGIDVGKSKLNACVVRGDAGREEHLEDLEVDHDDAGLATLLAAFAARGVTLVVLEATGGYERDVVAAAHDAGLPVAVANPAQVREFARGSGKRAKNDRVDAHQIARFGLLLRPEPRAVPDADRRLLDERAARRRQLIQVRTAERNRLEHAADAGTRKGLGRMIRVLDRELARLDGEIAAQVAAHPQWSATAALLAGVPGVGAVTAHALLADVPELGTLNRREVAALAGLAPYDHDSGRLKGRRCVSGGRGEVRSTLYMACLSAIRFNPAIRPMYRRLVDRGKRKMVAMVACMRKLLTVLNGIVKRGTPWDPGFAA